MKRYFYLLGLIIAIGGVVILGYLFRYRGGIIPAVPPAVPGGNLPAPANQGTGSSSLGSEGAAAVPGTTSVLVDVPVFDYFAKSAREALFVEPNGHISSVRGGKISAISAEAIDGLMRTQFSYDGAYLLVKSRVGNNAQFKIFNLAQKTWISPPAGVMDAAWSPLDNRLLLLVQKGDVTELATWNAADLSAKVQSLTPLDVIDVSLAWPDPLHVVIESHGSSASRGSVLVFDLKNKIFTAFVENQLGLASLWNSDGTRGLLWTSDTVGRGGELSLVNQSGTPIHALTFKTLPSKCAFGSTIAGGSATGTLSSLFCAIPRDQEGFLFHTLPDDYEKWSLVTSDDFYRVDLAQGDLASIATESSVESVDATKVSLKNGVLFFVNRLNGKLYALSM